MDASITTIKGISTTVAAKFNKLGAATIRDLLYYFPHRHLDYSQRKTISELSTGIEETIIANVWQVREVRLGNTAAAPKPSSAMKPGMSGCLV